MSRYANNDVCIPGTSRHRREWGFAAPKTQDEIASDCSPRVSKGWVSQFDNARFKLDRSGAMRAAPAFFPDEWKADPKHAIKRTWLLWFTNAEHYADEAIKRYANKMRDLVLSDLPGLTHTPILDPKQNPSLNDNVAHEPDPVIGMGDVREVPQDLVRKDRRRLA